MSSREACSQEGFVEEAFVPYFDILCADYAGTLPDKAGLLKHISDSYISIDSISGTYKVVDVLSVDKERVHAIEEQVSDWENAHYFSFDIQGMNSALANHLSDNFNYIGWACGMIVFLFLWFSFGRIELALLAFLPMAVSWIWILGIMGISISILILSISSLPHLYSDKETIIPFLSQRDVVMNMLTARNCWLLTRVPLFFPH